MCDMYIIGATAKTAKRIFRVTPSSKRNLEVLADIIDFNMASYFAKEPNTFDFFEFSDREKMSLINDHRERLVFGIIMTTIEYRKDNENLLILTGLMKNDDKSAKIYEDIQNKRNSAKVLFEDSYTFVRPDQNTGSIGSVNVNITPVNANTSITPINVNPTYTCSGHMISYPTPVNTSITSTHNYENFITSIIAPSSTIKKTKSNKYEIMTKLKSKLARDSKEQNDEYACIICADRKKLVVLLPCEHINHCVECAIVSIGVDNTCPVCRGTVEDVVVTF